MIKSDKFEEINIFIKLFLEIDYSYTLKMNFRKDNKINNHILLEFSEKCDKRVVILSACSEIECVFQIAKACRLVWQKKFSEYYKNLAIKKYFDKIYNQFNNEDNSDILRDLDVDAFAFAICRYFYDMSIRQAVNYFLFDYDEDEQSDIIQYSDFIYNEIKHIDSN